MGRKLRPPRAPAPRQPAQAPAPPRADGSFAFHFEPKNVAQREALELFPTADVLLMTGPAGTGKTIGAMGCAIGWLRRGFAERITLIRPTVEAGSCPLGWLGGSLDDKLDPHFVAFDHAIEKLTFRFPPALVRRLAISFIRGLTFTREVVVLDEAQNCTMADLRLVLSRLGDGAKLMVLGDAEQPDVPNSGWEDFVDRMEGATGVEVVEFRDEDTVRHPRLREWMKRLRG